MASKSMILSNFVTKQLLTEHILFKTISTHIIFFAVEVLFAIQDGRHRKPEVQKTHFER